MKDTDVNNELFENPDPDKYVLKIRRGKAVLVDKQILRWRKKRKKQAAKAAKTVDAPKVDKIEGLSDLTDINEMVRKILEGA